MAYSEYKKSSLFEKIFGQKNVQNFNRILNYRTFQRKCNEQSLYKKSN
jgi:hypothetical protein